MQHSYKSPHNQLSPIAIIGHSRLVTNGAMEIHDNNQPVIKNGIVGIHNGIVVNDTALWQQFPELQRDYEVDTEIILALIHKFYLETRNPIQAIRMTYQLLEGTASIAVLFDDLNILVLTTNNGSLYLTSDTMHQTHLFASEHYILHTLLQKGTLRRHLKGATIQHIEPGTGWVIDLATNQAMEFSLSTTVPLPEITFQQEKPLDIDEILPSSPSIPPFPPTILPKSMFTRFTIDVDRIKAIRRCARCLLPETMPFIEFDESGICNYCQNYHQIEVFGEETLMEFAEQHRSKNGRPDCIVTFSGGRDSSFGVHYMKNVLGMHPITYTYDWGMVTDLARRNQSRVCGKLRVEHILVSADIRRKRENIHKNVMAWLKRPDLGTVPLFMAGDKQYFYYANKLRKQTGVETVILCENPLESTKFKYGFCNVSPPFASHTHTLPLTSKFKMAAYYGKQYLLNPAYINGSILDTIGAFASYYFIPHNYLNLFDYLKWDEYHIVSTLRAEYDWEIAPDTSTTWRIGDGTAAFYNYIYYAVAGFTENDTFRSNQIREGMLSRKQALEMIYDENQPRFEALQWYCDTIHIDLVSTLERINSIPKLY